MEVISATAVWYSTGLPAVPLRWVLIRDPNVEFETQALLCTKLDKRRGGGGRSALRTTPEALRRRFASQEQQLRIAIEAGTHSPWVSPLLEGCGHEVPVAKARKLSLIYAIKRKTDEIDALRT